MKINIEKASDPNYEMILDVVSLTEFFNFVDTVGTVIVYGNDRYSADNGYRVVEIYDDYVE